MPGPIARSLEIGPGVDRQVVSIATDFANRRGFAPRDKKSLLWRSEYQEPQPLAANSLTTQHRHPTHSRKREVRCKTRAIILLLRHLFKGVGETETTPRRTVGWLLATTQLAGTPRRVENAFRVAASSHPANSQPLKLTTPYGSPIAIAGFAQLPEVVY
jgi:hypothetical protein